MNKTIFTAAAAFAICAVASSADAQPVAAPQQRQQQVNRAPGAAPGDNVPMARTAMQPRLLIGGILGTGGEINIEYDVEGPNDPPDDEDDALATLGLFGQYEMPVHPFFVLGGRLGFIAWNGEDWADDADIGRSYNVNLAAVAKARYPVSAGKGEVHVLVPLGMGYTIPTSDLEGDDPGQADEVSGGFAFTWGLLFGGQYMLDQIGIFGDVGIRSYGIAFTAENDVGGDTQESEATGDFMPFVIEAGVFFPM